MSRRNSSVVGVDTEQARRVSLAMHDVKQATADANKATESEQNMTLKQGLKLYPKAIAWSVLLSAAIIMEGFDKVLIANLFAVPAFKQKYGSLLPDGTYELTAAWQAGLTNGAYAGEILGLLLNGIIADRIGYRWTMMGALFAVNLFIFIVFFAQNIQMLLVGLIFCGIPWGVFQTLTCTYAAEVTPVPLRPILTTFVNVSCPSLDLSQQPNTPPIPTRVRSWTCRAFDFAIFMFCLIIQLLTHFSSAGSSANSLLLVF
jgi:SP family general alpha glucoside:H+ symporter-like MFS transporter